MKEKIDRRSFLKVSGLSAGGMLIGFNFFTSCKQSVTMPEDLALMDYRDFNAFIKIADNGVVTLFSPNPEIGQGVKTTLPMLIAEELCVSWDKVRVEQAHLDPSAYERQIAAGSTSVKMSWIPLRQVGATARQMLINAAAARMGVPPETCTIEEGIISNHKGDKLGIGEVVNEAAVMEVPSDVSLKNPKDFKIIGKAIYNVDSKKIALGKPLFGIDYKQEGMLYACMIRAPFGYTLASFDASSAKEIPGVVDVFAFKENNVAITAEDTFTAMKAAKQVLCKWEPTGQIPFSKEENKTFLRLLREGEYTSVHATGDVDRAFEMADKVVVQTYETPYLPHSCMEPMNFFADVRADVVKLAGSIQTPQNAVNRVAKYLKRDVNEISLEMTRIGGGFGRRLFGNYAVEAAAISEIAQNPIKLVYSREDDMCGGIYRPALNYQARAAIKDNKVIGYKLRQVGNLSFNKGFATHFPTGAIENIRIESVKTETEIPTGAWRSPQGNSIAFAEQCFFDTLAADLNMDPIDFQLSLLQKAQSTGNGQLEYSPERLATVIREVAIKAHWGNAPKGVFQGFAAYFSHDTYVAEIVEVVLNQEIPEIKRVVCVVDCGIVVNPLGAQNQIAGGIIDGIGHAMYGDFTIEDGRPTAKNFDKYRLIRMKETPIVAVHFVESDLAPTGLGEPSLPPAGPALANAIYSATGVRLLQQPFIKNRKVFG
ncbi:xanthine dehydrogenase family protein molybdopterin-binding subunit [Echinicola sediminis]